MFMAGQENDDEKAACQDGKNTIPINRQAPANFVDENGVIIEFSGSDKQGKNQRKNGKSAKGGDNNRAAQVAFETNSSLGSENCSIDSIQISDSVPQSSGAN